MERQRIMQWIDFLPNVEATGFQARRTEIERLVTQARECTAQADALVSAAYFESCHLEGEAVNQWSRSEIEAAKLKVGW
jgi:hypothetical protein